MANLTVKPDPDDYLDNFPRPRDTLPPESNSEAVEESPASNDSMSLKGQIWPGMGKMDLANEDMRRTRNQRKPKWVVEKMRRASEKIEPTQVVMSTQLVVERVKGVYDEDSSCSEEDHASTLLIRQGHPETDDRRILRERIPDRSARGNSHWLRYPPTSRREGGARYLKEALRQQ